MIDFEIENTGPFWIIRAKTDAARDHATEVFQEAERWNGGVVCESRYVQDVAHALHSEGFCISVNGVEVLEMTPA